MNFILQQTTGRPQTVQTRQGFCEFVFILNMPLISLKSYPSCSHKKDYCFMRISYIYHTKK